MSQKSPEITNIGKIVGGFLVLNFLFCLFHANDANRNAENYFLTEFGQILN